MHALNKHIHNYTILGSKLGQYGICHKKKKHKIYVTSTMEKYYKNITHRGYFKKCVVLAVNNLKIITVTKVGRGHETSQPSGMNDD
jgi:hypothetical protein